MDKELVKRWLRPFAFSIRVQPYGKRFRAPIIHGVGSSHRHGTEAWMVGALQVLFGLAGRAGLVDVGVNIGQTLLKLRSFDDECRYAGFEPSPFCVLYVNELIRLNRFRSCALLPVALAGESGLTRLETLREGDTAASMVEGLRGVQEAARTEYIATLRFDDLSLDLDDAPVVKIDVEGAEFDVVSGMRGFLRSSRPFVLCEVLHAHSADQLDLMQERNDALMSLLTELDYDVLRLCKDQSWATVTGVERVTSFPRETYRWDSQAYCDFLFSPRERAADAIAAFGVAPRAETSP
jgi:FkbM family methyltransferase